MFWKCVTNIFATIRKDNKILSYLNMKSSTILQTSQKTVCSCPLPNLHLFKFFPYFLQDFTIKAIKQLETRLITKPFPSQDINSSYLYFLKKPIFSVQIFYAGHPWTRLKENILLWPFLGNFQTSLCYVSMTLDLTSSYLQLKNLTLGLLIKLYSKFG